MKQLFLILMIFFFIYLISCKEKVTVNPEDFFYHYYQLKPGTELIYKTDSFVYNDFTNSIDTFSGYLKYVTKSVTKDFENRDNYLIHTYYRRNNTLNWQAVKVWTTLLDKNKNRAERFTDNKRYIPLVFPVRENKSWDCNALNASLPGDCRYLDVHQNFDNAYLFFDSIVTVEMLNDSSMIFHDYHIEKYAKNIGLIFVNIINLETQIDYTRGFIYEQKLIEYNLE